MFVINKYRIKFKKTDKMIYIGHLDLLKVFQRAVKRGKIDIAYSNGFNPHQQMSFALPLSLGMSSEGEYIDFELKTETDPETLVSQLNSVFPNGLEAIACRKFFEGEKNGASILTGAVYKVYCEDANAFKDVCKEIMDSSELIVKKKTKNSNKEVDIREDIFVLDVVDDYVYMVISAGSSKNLKPQLVMEYLYEKSGLEYNKFKQNIRRIEMLKSTENGFQTLMGEDFYEQDINKK